MNNSVLWCWKTCQSVFVHDELFLLFMHCVCVTDQHHDVFLASCSWTRMCCIDWCTIINISERWMAGSATMCASCIRTYVCDKYTRWLTKRLNHQVKIDATSPRLHPMRFIRFVVPGVCVCVRVTSLSLCRVSWLWSLLHKVGSYVSARRYCHDIGCCCCSTWFIVHHFITIPMTVIHRALTVTVTRWCRCWWLHEQLSCPIWVRVCNQSIHVPISIQCEYNQ